MSEIDDHQDESIEDIAGQLEFEPSTEDQPETPVESEQPTPEAPEAAKEETDQPEKTEGEEAPKDTPEVPKPEDKADDEAAQKERNRQFYEQRQAERQQGQRQIEQQIDQHYKPQELDELTQKYIDQGADEFQAQMLARDERREQQAQVAEARTQVAELNMQLQSEALQVLHEYPVFDPKSDQYDEDFANKASELYTQAAAVQTDPMTGYVVRTNLMPHKFYKELAEMRGSGVAKGESKGQQAAAQQMAAVQSQGSTAPVVHESKEDKQAADLESALANVR